MSLEAFLAAYEPALRAAHAADRERYAFPEDEIPDVIERTREAISTNRFNHDGPAYRAACKALGIKHTQTAIRAFCGVGTQQSAKSAKAVPLVQGDSTDPKDGTLIVRVAIDASTEELATLHAYYGIGPEAYAQRPLGEVELERWRRKHGLALIPGDRRTP